VPEVTSQRGFSTKKTTSTSRRGRPRLPRPVLFGALILALALGTETVASATPWISGNPVDASFSRAWWFGAFPSESVLGGRSPGDTAGRNLVRTDVRRPRAEGLTDLDGKPPSLTAAERRRLFVARLRNPARILDNGEEVSEAIAFYARAQRLARDPEPTEVETLYREHVGEATLAGALAEVFLRSFPSREVMEYAVSYAQQRAETDLFADSLTELYDAYGLSAGPEHDRSGVGRAGGNGPSHPIQLPSGRTEQGLQFFGVERARFFEGALEVPVPKNAWERLRHRVGDSTDRHFLFAGGRTASLTMSIERHDGVAWESFAARMQQSPWNYERWGSFVPSSDLPGLGGDAHERLLTYGMSLSGGQRQGELSLYLYDRDAACAYRIGYLLTVQGSELFFDRFEHTLAALLYHLLPIYINL